jgi:hypothetical protein
MRQLSLPVSKGSEDSITPKDRWISEHIEWREDPLEPTFDPSPSGQHDGEWSTEHLGKSSMLFFPFWRLDAKGEEVASRLRGICKGSHKLAHFHLLFSR